MKNRKSNALFVLSSLLVFSLVSCSPSKNEPVIPDEKEPEPNGQTPTDPIEDSSFIDMSSLNIEEAMNQYGFYILDNDKSKSYTTGDTVYFGSYPQAQVKDETIEKKLADLIVDYPTSENNFGWKDYGYYENGKESSFAFYKDVSLKDKSYRGVYILNYRPFYPALEASEDNSYIDDNGYKLKTIYWYEYSPIQWKVLSFDKTTGNLFLNASYNLDAQPFQTSYEFKNDKGYIPNTNTFINDYESSSIRKFLNQDFYKTAFSDMQQGLIQRTKIDNKTSGYEEDASYQKDQNDTEDKVFLLSYSDVKNTAYGYTGKGSSRSRSYTDYSLIQGLRTSSEAQTADGNPSCCYMLRSAGSESYSISVVNKRGAVEEGGKVDVTLTESKDGLAFNGDYGILPAIYLKATPIEQKGEWTASEHEYVNADGIKTSMKYSVFVPFLYQKGDNLPLITYVPDSSYVGKTAEINAKGACPNNWATLENSKKHPCFFLVFEWKDTNTSLTEGSQAMQVVPIIDKVVEEYGIDENRLYLTGQSMGGILDFALNDVYPDKFAATVYVGCQPGAEVNDDQYKQILSAAKFTNQKFVYIASRMDEKAPYGQDDVEKVLQANSIQYGKLYDLDHKGGDALEKAVKDVLSQGYKQNLFGFKQLTSSGDGVAEHMQSFKYAYAINAIFDWLVLQ